MSAKALLYDISQIDFNNIVADIDAIRRVNPQRYEMEQLTAVVYESPEEHVCIGYKDIATDEFWIRGHMPRMPLMTLVTTKGTTIIFNRRRKISPPRWNFMANVGAAKAIPIAATMAMQM